jgi:hypothetical protein
MGRRLLLVTPLLVAATVGALLRVAEEPAPQDLASTAAPVPRAELSVGVAHTAGASSLQSELDRCDGPVVARFAGIGPALLAEHDYCGGRWILRLRPGQVIRLSGSDVAGTYRVTERIKVVPKRTSSAALRGMGDLVAQTCRRDGRTLRLVGLSEID